MRAIAVIAAGGSGERLGAQAPKALVVCGGRPLLAWCLDAALAAHGVAGAVVAAHAGALPAFELVAGEAAGRAGKPVVVTPGGPSRSHSVRAAIDAAGQLGVEWDACAVHDAARPLATPALFDACLAGLADADCVVAAAPVTDTVKVAGPDMVVTETPVRAELWAAQTPQVFTRSCLERALDVDDEHLANATDDASLAEAAGARVKLLQWDGPNHKVTLPGDLDTVGALLAGGV
jgi:2-C-methyl-D-erythritol 4-phosphate cytidylyltransferase